MATPSCVLVPERISANLTDNYQDTVTEVYRCIYDSVQSNIYAALMTAQQTGPNPVPTRSALYTGASNIFARTISPTFESASREAILWSVTYSPPDKGEDEQQQSENPLLRPAKYNVEYIDTERKIEKARNVQALSHAGADGANRPADTEGKILNAAGVPPDVPRMHTTRHPVLVVERNYSQLKNIVDQNESYLESTNSDAILDFGVRTLKFLVTESLGKHVENEIEFWPGVTRVEVMKTTDLVLNNVGMQYWDTDKTKLVPIPVGEKNDPTTEPLNLTLAGGKGGDESTTITWRYLEEKSYATLLE